MKFQNILFNAFAITVLLSIPSKIALGNSETNSNPKINRAKSLEVSPDFAYAQAIKHQFIGSRIITQFAPKNSQGKNIDLNHLASTLGYDHFNWVSYVEKDPYGITNQAPM